jgi:hypothetical protein
MFSQILVDVLIFVGVAVLAAVVIVGGIIAITSWLNRPSGGGLL